RRLVNIIRIIPTASRNYFKRPFLKEHNSKVITVFGFYVAKKICLLDLGVNDVINAVLYVLIMEYVISSYYSRSEAIFSLTLFNNHKIDFTNGLLK
ncbi:hypothetical protein PHJA_001383200, partial [Phtheirospermum japonicum]